ncbi:hypothetical protein BH09BAC2_BH09BAC2_06810 [soil metagenome]
MGKWAVHTKKGIKFIGWCGLKYDETTKEFDLGYRFIKNEWGKGYACESASATINYGLKVLDLDCITGRADENNSASIKVMEKCGMKNIGIQVTDHCNAVTFKVFGSKN